MTCSSSMIDIIFIDPRRLGHDKGSTEYTKIKLWGAWMRYYIGKILLNIDDHHLSEAEDWIKKAIQSHKKYGIILYAELYTRHSGARYRINPHEAMGLL